MKEIYSPDRRPFIKSKVFDGQKGIITQKKSHMNSMVMQGPIAKGIPQYLKELPKYISLSNDNQIYSNNK